MYKRVETIEEIDWTDSERDTDTLVFLLIDPYPGVVAAAEQKLFELHTPDIPVQYEDTKLARIQFWVNWLVSEKNSNTTWATDREERSKIDPFDF